MMASNLLSRLLPSNNMAPSIYEDLRAHDEASELSDVEERAGMALDEENLSGGFHDYDLEHADVFNGEDSRVTTESTTFLLRQQGQQPRRQTSNERWKTPGGSKSKWMAQSPRLLEDDGDDDVPASLLIEGDEEPGLSQPTPRQNTRQQRPTKLPPVPGLSTRDSRARWDTVQAHQRLHLEDATRPQPLVPKPGLLTGNPRERALWTWINVTNLDHFMAEVYDYYIGAGIWCICLERFLSLLTIAFVATFTTFLTHCIDYTKVPQSKMMSEIWVPQCTEQITGVWNVAIWLLALVLIWRFCSYLNDIRRLKRMHDFYLHLLNVPDSDMQTVSWQDIVARIMALRDANPLTAEKVAPALRKYTMGSQSKERLDAHDIANRLMRKENYLIALFNKEILDLTLPVPIFRNRQFFSRTIEWNLHYCILDFIFNEQGQVRQLVLKDTHRRQLSDGMRSRFLFAGFMNMIFAPVIVIYLLIVYFFKYFNEYQKNPSALGSRQYTPLAEWKFREFNELQHLFNNRINMSYPFASRYIEQFPKVKTEQVFRFIAFVAGAIVSVLALASVLDPELFLAFEITPGRTVIFYLGVFGTIWAVSHGAIPEENMVFDPEYALRNVIEYTHYMPSQWKDRLHSDEVKREFSELYQMKTVIFFEELLSIIFTPFVLWFSLPQCSDRIIDFFREFTVHVDGLGYVCSFAVFDFKKGVGNATQQGAGTAVDGLRDDYYSTKHGKMAASYYGFIDNYVTNPKTGIPGHVPPGMRPQFQPPPAFPGLMSPTLATDMAASRMGRSERPRSRAPTGTGLAPARTPRFAPSAAHASPLPSMLLDPHHQPSTSGFGGGRSMQGRRSSRSRYLPHRNIIEDPIEDEEEEGAGDMRQQGAEESSGPDIGGLDESKWETSPTRTTSKAAEDEEDSAGGNAGGVLGLLYQFHQKAQSDGRAPGVHI